MLYMYNPFLILFCSLVIIFWRIPQITSNASSRSGEKGAISSPETAPAVAVGRMCLPRASAMRKPYTTGLASIWFAPRLASRSGTEADIARAGSSALAYALCATNCTFFNLCASYVRCEMDEEIRNKSDVTVWSRNKISLLIITVSVTCCIWIDKNFRDIHIWCSCMGSMAVTVILCHSHCVASFRNQTIGSIIAHRSCDVRFVPYGCWNWIYYPTIGISRYRKKEHSSITISTNCIFDWC
jgi:hypothetical protein